MGTRRRGPVRALHLLTVAIVLALDACPQEPAERRQADSLRMLLSEHRELLSAREALAAEITLAQAAAPYLVIDLRRRLASVRLAGVLLREARLTSVRVSSRAAAPRAYRIAATEPPDTITTPADTAAAVATEDTCASVSLHLEGGGRVWMACESGGDWGSGALLDAARLNWERWTGRTAGPRLHLGVAPRDLRWLRRAALPGRALLLVPPP